MLSCSRLKHSALEKGHAPVCPFRHDMTDIYCTLQCAWLQPTNIKVDAHNSKTVWHCALMILGEGLFKKIR